MKRDILTWPDRRLQTVAIEVAEINDSVRATWDDMIDTMEAMPGVGLAAVQIGVMQRLAVVDASEERGQAVRMANPVILHSSEKDSSMDEASPCLPGLFAKVVRPRAVDVQYINELGVLEQKGFVGLWAVSVQHQIDHLNGKMFFDRISRTKRQMMLKKAAKAGRS